jgi:hypothetical protein
MIIETKTKVYRVFDGRHNDNIANYLSVALIEFQTWGGEGFSIVVKDWKPEF